MSLRYNDAAERLLSSHGLACEPEPGWVSGRVPDFYCTGKAKLWVEVKSLDEPEEFKASARAFDWLKERGRTLRNRGKVWAVVSDDMSQRDAKVALAMTDRLLGEMAADEARPDRVFVVIPRDPEYGRFVRIEAWSGDRREVFHCCRSASGRYGHPYLGDDLTEDRPAVVVADSGDRRDALPHELGLFNDDFLLSLELELSDQPFSVKSVRMRGGATSIPNVRKFRACGADANRQFLSGCEHRDAPCLLMVFHDDVLVSTDLAFASAFYGDMTVSFSTDLAADVSPIGLGRNGVWGPDKNRTTSAACYVRNAAAPIMVHNLWAKNSLATGLFGCVEYLPKEDGSLERLDPAPTE